MPSFREYGIVGLVSRRFRRSCAVTVVSTDNFTAIDVDEPSGPFGAVILHERAKVPFPYEADSSTLQFPQ